MSTNFIAITFLSFLSLRTLVAKNRKKESKIRKYSENIFFKLFGN